MIFFRILLEAPSSRFEKFALDNKTVLDLQTGKGTCPTQVEDTVNHLVTNYRGHVGSVYKFVLTIHRKIVLHINFLENAPQQFNLVHVHISANLAVLETDLNN